VRPRWASKPRRTDRLTVGRNLTLTSQLVQSAEKSSESQSEKGGSGPWLGGHGQRVEESAEKSSESQSEKGGSGPCLGGHGQSSLSRQFGDCEVGLQEVLGPGKRLSS
jgi:hypothetical protein